jgi:succinoglycan biosynthesis transport protein ExoP
MNETTDATSIFAPLWRHKWLILAVGIVVAVGSYLYYKRERPLYRATTQIYLAEEQGSSERSSNSKRQGAAVSDQVAIINQIVVEQARRALRKAHKGALLRGAKAHAAAAEKSPFVTVTAEAHSAKGAALLANTTAQTYIRRQRASRRRSIEQAITISRRQLARIEASSVVAPKSKPAKSKGSTTSSTTTTTTTTTPSSTASSGSGASVPSTANVLQEANLSSKINQLESSLAATGAQQIKPATRATARLLSPTPKRNAIFGFVIGLVLAAIAAYVLTRADRRLRSLAGIERAFSLQLLVGLPQVRRPIVRRDGRPVPSRFLLEPLRGLHTALQLGPAPGEAHGRAARVILFTSADAGDGKSTLIADLALVQRDAGERVAVVEADFRRPVLPGLLGLDRGHGLAEVLMGTLSVEDAVQRVLPNYAGAGSAALEPSAAVATATEARRGSLFLLAGGGPAANPPALLAHGAMSNVLRSVAEDADYVLIDAPSPLEVSDVMPLLNIVDGIVVVARVGHTRELAATRLAQLLASTPHAPVLGVVGNCVPRREAERYGFHSPNGRARPGRLLGR